MLATADKYGGGHFLKLVELYRALFGEEFENPHDACADATACAECFWELKTLGELDNYDHPRVLQRLRSHFRRTYQEDLDTILQRFIRSASAQAAWDRRRAQGPSWPGGVDALVLQRIRSLPSTGFGAFLAGYANLYSSNSAAYIKRALSQDKKVLLKPETSWRCIVAYCRSADSGERAELARIYLSHASKSYKDIQIAPGQEDPGMDSIIREASVAPKVLRDRLLEICAGDEALVARLEAEHTKPHGEEAVQVRAVLQRCASGDRTICGVHRFTLPYIELTLAVQTPSPVRRLFSFLGQMLGGQ